MGEQGQMLREQRASQMLREQRASRMSLGATTGGPSKSARYTCEPVAPGAAGGALGAAGGDDTTLAAALALPLFLHRQ